MKTGNYQVWCLSFTLILLFFTNRTLGNTIQWASEVDFEYNSYDTLSWSAQQVVGPPDARPLGQLSPKAFRIREEAGF